MKKIRTWFASVVGGGGILFFLMHLFLPQLGENVFTTWYGNNIEPILNTRLYYNISWKQFSVDKSEAHSITLLDLILIAIVIILLIWGVAYLTTRSKKQKSDLEKISGAMKSLTDEEEYVLSAQVYHFKISNEKKEHERYKRIMIDHVASHYDQGMDINAIVHEEFLIDEKYYSAIKTFSYLMSRFEETKNNSDNDKAVKAIEPWLQKLKKEITVPEDKIDERACILFSLYKGIKSILENEKWGAGVDGISDEVVNKLRYGKRTGCLPAILLQSAYIFRNESSLFKSNRAYYSMVVEPSILPQGNKNLLIVLTLSYDLIQSKDQSFFQKDLYEEVNQYVENAIGGSKGAGNNG